MDFKEETLVVYKKILSGELQKYPKTFFDVQYRNKRIIVVMQYLVEEVMGTTPEKAVSSFTIEDVDRYKIKRFLFYVEKPCEYGADEVKHLIYFAYPEMKRDYKQEVIDMYEDIYSGRRALFPALYFREGDISVWRAQTILRYVCEKYLAIHNYEELEKTFSPFYKKGSAILKEYKLGALLSSKIFFSNDDLMRSVFAE